MSTPLAMASISKIVVMSPAARMIVDNVWIPLIIASKTLSGILIEIPNLHLLTDLRLQLSEVRVSE